MPLYTKAPESRRVDYNMEELQFSRTSHHLSHILDQHPLPRVIQCDRKTAPPTGSKGTSLDLTKPLLAYSKRSVRKVHAYNVVFDSRSREFLPVGNNLLVPEDYTGWFFVLGPEDSVSQDTPVPYYRSLAELAASTCSTFLTAGHDLLDAFLIESNHQIPCKILPGTLLNILGLHPEVKPQIRGSKPKKGKKFTPRWFLKCIDEQDRELLVCTNQMGRFYVIDQNDAPVKHPFMQMKTILERYKFPLLVKLVYGRVPTTPCSFTSTLLLTNCGKNHTVVASTLLNGQNINLEIPVATDMKFHIAEENPGLKGSRIYMNAVGVCRKQVSTYVKNIKVIYGEPLLEDDETEDTSKNNASDQTKNNGSDQSKNNASDQSEVRTPPQDGNDRVQLRVPTRKRGGSVLSRSNMDEVLKRLTISEEDPSMYSQLSPENPNGHVSVNESNESVPGSVETPPYATPLDAVDKRQAFQNHGHDDPYSHEYDNRGDHSFTGEYDDSSRTGSHYSSSSDTSSEYATPRGSLASTHSIEHIAGQSARPRSWNDYTPLGDHSPKPTKKVKPKTPPKPRLKGEDSSSGKVPTCDDGYLTPIHVDYSKLEDEYCSASNTYEELKDENPEQNLSHTQNTEANAYSELLNDDETPQKAKLTSTDSGVFDDPDNTPTLNGEEIPTAGVPQSRHDIKGPLLPSRTKVPPKGPKPKSLGQAVIHSISDSDPELKLPSSGPSNKEKLIKELKKAGINASSELAFRGLQIADITNLLQTKEEDVQDELVALLPKVGQVDLRKIALCLREMKMA